MEHNPKISILLSLYNGEKYLETLLRSLEKQTYKNWVLIWRDDGSTDQTKNIMHTYLQKWPHDKSIEITIDHKNIGVSRSFSLLMQSVKTGSYVAFCDQDDEWFPQKIERGITALHQVAQEQKISLYCSRQMLTDSNLKPYGLSSVLPSNPSFLMALTQNIATGCTIILSPGAVEVINKNMPPPRFTLHDWWSYLLVSGVGGIIITDNEPSLYYRQHDNNTVGAPRFFIMRAWSAFKRGPSKFMRIFGENIEALLQDNVALEKQNKSALLQIQSGLHKKGLLQYIVRYNLLKTLSKMRRSKYYESFVFYIWFIRGIK